MPIHYKRFSNNGIRRQFFASMRLKPQTVSQLEPGSKVSVIARLRRISACDPKILFGLYEGAVAIAKISPVLILTNTAVPDSAFYFPLLLF